MIPTTRSKVSPSKVVHSVGQEASNSSFNKGVEEVSLEGHSSLRKGVAASISLASEKSWEGGAGDLDIAQLLLGETVLVFMDGILELSWKGIYSIL